jgi:hypothetical protein
MRAFPEALAQAMQVACNGFAARRNAVLQDVARARFPQRLREFRERYRHIVKDATSPRKAVAELKSGGDKAIK